MLISIIAKLSVLASIVIVIKATITNRRKKNSIKVRIDDHLMIDNQIFEGDDCR